MWQAKINPLLPGLPQRTRLPCSVSVSVCSRQKNYCNRYERDSTSRRVRSEKNQIPSISVQSDQNHHCLLKEVMDKAPSEDSDQTARMRSLIWVFAGRTCTNTVLRFQSFVLDLNTVCKDLSTDPHQKALSKRLLATFLTDTSVRLQLN